MTDAALLLKVRAALKAVSAPGGGDLVSRGAIAGLSATTGGVVRFTLDAERSGGDPQILLAKARAAAEAVEGVSRVAAIATGVAPAAGGHDNPLGVAKTPRIETAARELAGVRKVIAIASGKGGVGKSTLAANLAVAMARLGLKVGLLDADIYGPSLPTLFGLEGRADIRDGKIAPVEKFGVKAMSIGLLVDPDKALAWRGPMVMGAVRQLIADVDWGELDILVLDTPPGTGDTHLSLIQSKRLDGVIIVSTPQEMALADVRRGAALFRQANVAILGVVENMSFMETPSGERLQPFGEGGAERTARDIGAPFLGALPIYPDVRIASDAGAPVSAPSPAAAAFDSLAQRIIDAINA